MVDKENENLNEVVPEEYPHHYRLVELMCDVTGVDIETVDFNDREWYLTHEWSEDEYEEWLERAVKYVKDNESAQKTLMEWPSNDEGDIRDVLRIGIFGWAWNYGWKMNDEWSQAE